VRARLLVARSSNVLDLLLLGDLQRLSKSASLLLQQGESPVYVQRQLGHASIQLTVDTYGRWLAPDRRRETSNVDN